MSSHGRRLLPTTIDELARKDPNRSWGSMQATRSLEFYDISISAFANAINRIAHWIIATVGQPPQDDNEPPVLAYIGASDLRYYVIFVAIVKAGYVPLFCSHQNSKAANTSLLNQTGCKTLLNGFEDLSNIALDTENFKVYHVPSSESVWDTSAPVDPFPFNPSFDDMFAKPLLIIHTSGSTGFPKPITYTHGSFACYDLRQDLPNYKNCIPEPRFRCQSSRLLLGLPPFHASGFVTGLQDSIWFERTIVFPPADRKLDAKCVGEMVERGGIGGAALLPHVLEEVARDPEVLVKLEKLEWVSWVGGPISKETGDLISSRTTLINAYGSTETGIANTLVKSDPTLWSWYFFHPDTNGYDFRPIHNSNDNLHELFIVRDPSLATTQVVFRIFPHLTEWPMKDLFVPHPDLPHHWRLVGRSDDLIVLKDGTKVNPRAAELAVKRVGGVREAMMFGNGRERVGMLFELEEEIKEVSSEEDVVDRVFSVLEGYNSTAPPHAVIGREFVALAKKSKPFPRAGKNTLQRGLALEIYGEEIEEIYRRTSPSSGSWDFRLGTS